MLLLKAYRQYLHDPGKYCHMLLEAILFYSFHPDWVTELQLCAQSLVNKSYPFITIYSNTNQPYSLGPLGGFWLSHIEKALEFVPKNEQVCLNTTLVEPILKENFVSINPFRFDWDKVLVEHLNQLPFTTLYAAPNLLLPLCQSKPFIEFCNKNITQIIATGEPPFFFPFHPRINNKMINWQTGVNFYTCSHNTLHFLPIFAILPNLSINLLNLVQSTFPLDDYFACSSEIRTCLCGKNYVPFSFLPHLSTLPRLGYREFMHYQLKDQYFNYQVVQIGEENHTFYTKLNGYKDPTPINPHPNQFCKIGRKRPALWKVGSFPEKGNNFWECPSLVVFRSRTHL